MRDHIDEAVGPGTGRPYGAVISRDLDDGEAAQAASDADTFERLTGDPRVRGRVPEIEQAIAGGVLSPTAGAAEIVRLLGL